MATVRYTDWGTKKTLTGPTLLVLGTGGNDTVRSIIVELRPTAATYSMTPRGRVPDGTNDAAATDTALAWTDLTSETPNDGSTTPVAATTSSATRLIRLTGDGLTVSLDFATLSVGSVDVVISGVLG